MPDDALFAAVMDPANRADPYPLYAQLRARPVSRQRDGSYVVSTHAAIRALIFDPRLSSEDLPPFKRPSTGNPIRDWIINPIRSRIATAHRPLIFRDPPDHDTLRAAVMREFTIPRVQGLRPRVVREVDALLDKCHGRDRLCLVEDLSYPLPVSVICELLGVPYADRDEFQTRAGKQIDLTLPIEERGKVFHEARAYMGELVDRARAEPGDDLLGMLIREHGDDVMRSELVGIASLLLIAGHETTANMLALGTLVLLRHPEQAALVRDDPDAVAPAVEELMRFLSIVHAAVPRVAIVDTEVGGQAVAAGDLVLVQLAAADRDRALADDPDRLDVGRAAAPHVAFGHGVHHCLGAPLARMEMATAFPALLQRFPTLATTTTELARADFREGTFIYGMRSLPLTW